LYKKDSIIYSLGHSFGILIHKITKDILVIFWYCRSAGYHRRSSRSML